MELVSFFWFPCMENTSMSCRVFLGCFHPSTCAKWPSFSHWERSNFPGKSTFLRELILRQSMNCLLIFPSNLFLNKGNQAIEIPMITQYNSDNVSHETQNHKHNSPAPTMLSKPNIIYRKYQFINHLSHTIILTSMTHL